MFRSLGKSKIAFVLAILFGISLFFFKSGSSYSNFFNSDAVVASVSGTSVSTNQFSRKLQLNINNFNQMLGKTMTSDEIKAFQVHSVVLSSLINDAIFENEFDNLDFKIDEQVIALKTKEKLPQLYDQNNKLDENYLSVFLQQQQLKIEDIIQIINFETRNKYFSDAFFQTKYPQYFDDKINNYNNHERNISYIEIPIEDINIDKITNKSNLDQNEILENFYTKNIDQYMSKEKRNIEYLVLDKKMFSSNFSVSDFEAEEYYNANKDLFYQNEKRSFIQFNFKKIEEAEDFKGKIKNFDLDSIIEFAKNNNILFNEFKSLQMNEVLEPIAKEIFNLKINEQSNIIETSLAKHLIIVKSIETPIQNEFQQVKEEIIKSITKIESNNFYNDTLNQISEQIINGQSLSEIAAKFNLKKDIIYDLTTDYNDYSKFDKNLLSNLIDSSFSSNKDFVNDIINVNENLSYVFNVLKINQSSPLKFKDIKKQIQNDWSISKKIEKMTENIEQNKENKLFLIDLSKEYSLKVNEISISKNSNFFDRKKTDIIFQSDNFNNVGNFDDNNFFIARINKITMPNASNRLEKLDLSNNLKASFGQELMKEKKISINDNMVNAIIEQY